MQLGMIGLGRMGANIVRRLMRDGHDCVVFDVNADAVAELQAEGAAGATSLADFASKLTAPRAAWIMVPAAYAGSTAMELAEHFHADDIIIDGGNSLLPRRRRAGGRAGSPRDPLPRRGHERRGVRAGARLLHDDRRRRGRRGAARPDLPHARPRHRGGRQDARALRRSGAARARLPALRSGGRGALREDGPQRHRVRGDGGVRRGDGDPGEGERRRARADARRRDDAAARPAVLPLRHRHGRGGRGLEAGQRDLVLAARPDRHRAQRGPGARGVQRPGLRFGRGALDGGWPRWTRACPRTCSRQPCSSASARGARPTTRTSCSRRCASSSAATTRSRPNERRQDQRHHRPGGACRGVRGPLRGPGRGRWRSPRASRPSSSCARATTAASTSSTPAGNRRPHSTPGSRARPSSAATMAHNAQGPVSSQSELWSFEVIQSEGAPA